MDKAQRIEPDAARRWLDELSDEDVAFIKRFLLASGSLKALAEAYAVSYPTIRLRLDRLIAKIEILVGPRGESEFERALRLKFAEGTLDAGTVKFLLSAHRRELEAHDGSRNSEAG